MHRFSLRRRSTAAGIGLLVLVSASLACSTEVEVRTTAPTATALATSTVDAPASTPAVGEDASGSSSVDTSWPGGASSDEPDAGSDGLLLRTPARGEAVAVVGVAFDQSVAVRRDPRPDADVIAELAPLFDGATGTGQGRTVGTTGWWRIRVDGREGWVEASSMARLGAVTDVTDDVLAALGEDREARTVRALGRLVTQARLGEGDAAEVVVSAVPRAGDRDEVVYDVVDRRDASIIGERLVVRAAATDGGDGFSLGSVEATTFCARGVTADGRCT